jgi:hypothetical protein
MHFKQQSVTLLKASRAAMAKMKDQQTLANYLVKTI